jgi:superfamily I DNA and RNA helicase
LLTYGSRGLVADATKRAVTRALQAGFRLADIVIVTFSGRERSLFGPLEQLGPHRLKRWLGRYDLFGAPQYSDGDVLIETVYRFKGQSAPCVILTEVDFETFDEPAQRKLFVGLTRASMKAIVVLSERAARMLELAIDRGGETLR